MAKRICISLLFVSTIIASSLSVFATDFWSGASKWAKPDLNHAFNVGLVPPSMKGTDMKEPITREEFAEASVLLYEGISEKKARESKNNPFTDVTNPAILKAYELGIIEGVNERQFAPKEPCTREQVSTMLARTIKSAKSEINISGIGAQGFFDLKDISSFAVDDVLFMVKQGIVKGINGRFYPKSSTKREEAMVMCLRINQNIDKIISSNSGTTITVADARNIVKELFPKKSTVESFYINTGLPYNKKISTTYEDLIYYSVTGRINSIDALVNATETVFTREYAAKEFYTFAFTKNNGNPPYYLEIDGVLYFSPDAIAYIGLPECLLSTLIIRSYKHDHMVLEMDNYVMGETVGKICLDLIKVNSEWRIDDLIIE